MSQSVRETLTDKVVVRHVVHASTNHDVTMAVVYVYGDAIIIAVFIAKMVGFFFAYNCHLFTMSDDRFTKLVLKLDVEKSN